jgi:hypothetical protein
MRFANALTLQTGRTTQDGQRVQALLAAARESREQATQERKRKSSEESSEDQMIKKLNDIL